LEEPAKVREGGEGEGEERRQKGEGNWREKGEGRRREKGERRREKGERSRDEEHTRVSSEIAVSQAEFPALDL
jgi:hypothetical protein